MPWNKIFGNLALKQSAMQVILNDQIPIDGIVQIRIFAKPISKDKILKRPCVSLTFNNRRTAIRIDRFLTRRQIAHIGRLDTTVVGIEASHVELFEDSDTETSKQ